MASSKIFFLCVVLQLTCLFLVPIANAQGLKVGFYEKTCPKAEVIVKGVVDYVMSVAPSLSGPLLRMHFHDCFIRGCDGSVLLNSTPPGTAEKDSLPNQSLRGFSTIDRVKAAVEEECPGVVSCADILALVARDFVVATGGYWYAVETGRRDGSVSNATEALNNLIPPIANITTQLDGFKRRGLNAKDLVVLAGGHTIGTSHCGPIDARIHNFTGKGDADPTIDPNYVVKLKAKCKPNDQTTLIEMDPGSVRTFDNKYYILVAKRRGLFQSDAALLDNPETKAYVLKAAKDGSAFLTEDFGASMVNMGRIGVLTGTAGEIRKVCYKTN